MHSYLGTYLEQGEIEKLVQIVVGKPGGKKELSAIRHWWNDDFRIRVKDTQNESVYWIKLPIFNRVQRIGKSDH
jgi:hypothetical protein